MDVRMSVLSNPDNWAEDVITIKSPFNMESILRSCPKLLEAWKKKPFVFAYKDVGGDGCSRDVLIRYPLEIKKGGRCPDQINGADPKS